MSDNGGGITSGYWVWIDGVKYSQSGGLSQNVTGQTPGATVAVTVSAFDDSGNESAQGPATNATLTDSNFLINGDFSSALSGDDENGWRADQAVTSISGGVLTMTNSSTPYVNGDRIFQHIGAADGIATSTQYTLTVKARNNPAPLHVSLNYDTYHYSANLGSLDMDNASMTEASTTFTTDATVADIYVNVEVDNNIPGDGVDIEYIRITAV